MKRLNLGDDENVETFIAELYTSDSLVFALANANVTLQNKKARPNEVINIISGKKRQIATHHEKTKHLLDEPNTYTV